MKIILLDIDDTLAKENVLDECSLANLKLLIDATGASIVLSSDWKFSPKHLARLEDEFGKLGIPKWIDTTPFKPIEFSDRDANRANEILDWLSRHPEVTNWVILDDMLMFNCSQPEIKDHFVHTLWTLFDENKLIEAKKILEG